jgi:glycogen synthase
VRILVVSTLYPPIAFGGYEVECSAVVERLAEQHDVLVLTSSRQRIDAIAADRDHTAIAVRRELAFLTPDERGALRAPFAAIHAADAARDALQWRPDFIYAWNGGSIPHAALRVLADSNVPLAFRICEHWFSGLFVLDQFMRELRGSPRGPARTSWAVACRAVNLLPALRLDVTAPVRTAISWNSEAIRRMVNVPPFVETVLERVTHSVPRYGDLYAALERSPSEHPQIAFLGRVVPFKGLATAIEALAILRSEHDLVATLVVAGPEDRGHGAELRDLATRLGISDAVQWRGPQEPEEIARLLAGASALIVPSAWDEPFPLVTIEGALARVPLVASDVGGISEGMQDEQHALLFPREDAPAAAVALARTLRESAHTAARVERAYERAQEFRVEPYLAAQERFVLDAVSVLGNSGDSRP